MPGLPAFDQLFCLVYTKRESTIIAHLASDITSLDSFHHPFRYIHVQCYGLLNEYVDTIFSGNYHLVPMGEGGQTNVNDIQLLLIKHFVPISVYVAAVLSGKDLRLILNNITESGQLNLFHSRKPCRVVPGYPTTTDHANFELFQCCIPPEDE